MSIHLSMPHMYYGGIPNSTQSMIWYTCLYTHVYTHIYAPVYTYAYSHVYAHVYAPVYTCVYTDTSSPALDQLPWNGLEPSMDKTALPEFDPMTVCLEYLDSTLNTTWHVYSTLMTLLSTCILPISRIPVSLDGFRRCTSREIVQVLRSNVPCFAL